jgi:HEAT repeat protein
MFKNRLGLVLIVVVALLAVLAWFEPSRVVRGWLAREAFFQGRPSSYWSQAVRNDDPQARLQTLSALKKGGDKAIPVLVELLGETTPPADEAVEVRWTAGDLLGQLGRNGAAAVPALAGALKDPDAHVRGVAIRALGQIGPAARDAVAPLTGLLGTDDRLDALKALAGLGADARPAQEQLVVLLKHPDDTVRWQAARVLGKIGPSAAGAVPALIEALKDDDDEVREHAAESLGDIGPTVPSAGLVVAALTATLKDAKSNVRRDAVRSLGQLGPLARPSLPEVKKLLSDPASPVRDAAARSIRQIDVAKGNKQAK